MRSRICSVYSSIRRYLIPPEARTYSRTSCNPSGNRVYINDRFSLSQRDPHPLRQLISRKTEQYRPSILGIPYRVNLYPFLPDHLHLIARATIIRLRHEEIGNLHLIGLQNSNKLSSFSSSTTYSANRSNVHLQTNRPRHDF